MTIAQELQAERDALHARSRNGETADAEPDPKQKAKRTASTIAELRAAYYSSRPLEHSAGRRGPEQR